VEKLESVYTEEFEEERECREQWDPIDLQGKLESPYTEEFGQWECWRYLIRQTDLLN